MRVKSPHERSADDRPARKAAQIMEGARAVFLESGYDGASIDAIARRAGVSKPTVYAHFDGKEGLFGAFLRTECAKHAEAIFRVEEETDDLRETLRSIAEHYIDLILSPLAQANFRVAVAESGRFSDLGRVFYESTIARATARLGRLLAQASERGDLSIDDIERAAHQFLALCRADTFYPQLFNTREALGPAERRRHAEATVDAFWRIYAP